MGPNIRAIKNGVDLLSRYGELLEDPTPVPAEGPTTKSAVDLSHPLMFSRENKRANGETSGERQPLAQALFGSDLESVWTFHRFIGARPQFGNVADTASRAEAIAERSANFS